MSGNTESITMVLEIAKQMIPWEIQTISADVDGFGRTVIIAYFKNGKKLGLSYQTDDEYRSYLDDLCGRTKDETANTGAGSESGTDKAV